MENRTPTHLPPDLRPTPFSAHAAYDGLFAEYKGSRAVSPCRPRALRPHERDLGRRNRPTAVDRDDAPLQPTHDVLLETVNLPAGRVDALGRPESRMGARHDCARR